MPTVDTALSLQLYPLSDQHNAIVVVIDVLRATSAICTAFENGAKEMIPVANVEEALEYQKKGFLVGAERNGEKLEGFDFGNSPYDYMDPKIKDQTLVLTTTNGTQAIEIAKDNYMVVIGAFTNITALSDWLIKQDKNIILLCAGWKGRVNLEDSLFAGAVVERLFQSGKYETFTDASLAAHQFFLSAEGEPGHFLRNSSHRRRLSKLNLKEDIKYCLQLDKSVQIPVLQDGVLVRLQVEEKLGA